MRLSTSELTQVRSGPLSDASLVEDVVELVEVVVVIPGGVAAEADGIAGAAPGMEEPGAAPGIAAAAGIAGVAGIACPNTQAGQVQSDQ